MTETEKTVREQLRTLILKVRDVKVPEERSEQLAETFSEYANPKPALILSPFEAKVFAPVAGSGSGNPEANAEPAQVQAAQGLAAPAVSGTPVQGRNAPVVNPNPVMLPFFEYGSRTGDDIIGFDPRDVDTEFFAKVCRTPGGYILLVFSIDDIFERCFRYTAMKSKIVDHQSQNQSPHLINLLALTEDEYGFFVHDFLEHSAVEIHNIIGAGGRDAGVRSMNFNPGTVGGMGAISYALAVPEGGFFHNYVLQLYENIASAFYYSVLQQWAQWCNDSGEIQANGMKYETVRNSILSFRHIGKAVTRKARYY